jgi:hypothetical protein
MFSRPFNYGFYLLDYRRLRVQLMWDIRENIRLLIIIISMSKLSSF